MKNIAVVLHTCDHYSEIWRGWYLSFKNNWDFTLGWKVYFANEQSDLPFDDKRIRQLKTPKSLDKNGFSDRLLYILNTVPEDWILYLQEDMWLSHPVNGDLFQALAELAASENVNALKIHEKLSWWNYQLEKTDFFIHGKRVLRYKANSDFLMTHNASIWRKSFLVQHVSPNQDPWLNEKATTQVMSKLQDSRIYHYNHRWYVQPYLGETIFQISKEGRLTDFGKAYLRNLEYLEHFNRKFKISK